MDGIYGPDGDGRATQAGGYDDPEIAASDKALAKKLRERIKADKEHHQKAFRRMREDMFLATYGRDRYWPKESYTANIVGRHVRQKTAALYAKNPRAVARRRQTLDFAVWDENPDTLMQAMQVTAAVMQPQVAVDPMTGQQVMVAPQIGPEIMQAQAVVQDFQAGMARRQELDRVGRTLEVLFEHFMREQRPVEFKTGMKQMVRRACTTGVGYVKLGFARETGPASDVENALRDARARLDHLHRLLKEAGEGEIEPDDAEMAELERTIADLLAQPEIVLNEGLVFDFPQSTRVIPDKQTRTLVGFTGARHLTIEHLFSPDEVEEIFGIEMQKGKYHPYALADGEGRSPDDCVEMRGSAVKDGMVCVWEHYDKLSGLVYFLADGYEGYLREPAAPDVFVEDFWPVYALTFNEVENEDALFPPSDAALLSDMQAEYNRSRQGKREHRDAARPRWVATKGAFSADDAKALADAAPFSVTFIEAVQPGQKIGDILQALPVPGVDPNLYDTGEVFSDVQLVGGAQEANYGAVAKATATESAIAANATAASDSTAVDDLDAFLTAVFRAAGQVLLREMSGETVTQIAGPGALWPQATLAEISSLVYLDVEAGSSGKPNRATEIQNWQQMLPFMLQMPGLNPLWLLRESLRRLDDKMDVTDAISAGLPSIMSQNRMSQASTGDPATDPNQQGGEGGDNAPAGPAEEGAGTDPAFGSNQV